MNYKKTLVLLMLAFLGSKTLAQSPYKLSFQKNKVLDVLLGTTKPESHDKQQLYFDDVFPVAQEAGFSGIQAIGIPESPTLGNYHPQFLAFGQWASFKARKDGMEQVQEKIPDLYQRRKDIWSTFYMTVYELKEDIEIEFLVDKIYVFTAYWLNNAQQTETFIQGFSKEVSSQKGKIVLGLTQGKSPVEYYYSPDYVVITEWNTQADFEQFMHKSAQKTIKELKNVHQFKIQAY